MVKAQNHAAMIPGRASHRADADMGGGDLFLLPRHDDAAFDGLAQLPQVAGPGVAGQRSDGVGRQTLVYPALEVAVFLEMLRQRRDIRQDAATGARQAGEARR